MTNAAPSIDILEVGVGQVARLLASVRGDQLDSPTPCGEWQVRDLARHMVGGVRSFLDVVEGRVMSGFDVAIDDADLPRAYQRGAGALIAAWRADGTLDRRFRMFGGEMPAGFVLNLQITEAAIHSWDLATATAQQVTLDPVLAETALAFTQQNLGAEMRGTSFGPAQEAPPGADAYARLAAFTGRAVERREELA